MFFTIHLAKKLLTSDTSPTHLSLCLKKQIFSLVFPENDSITGLVDVRDVGLKDSFLAAPGDVSDSGFIFGRWGKRGQIIFTLCGFSFSSGLRLFLAEHLRI